MTVKQYLKLVLVGFILFFIIGSLSSCKTSEQSTYKYKSVTPNTQHLNEGEYIKHKQIIKYRG